MTKINLDYLLKSSELYKDLDYLSGLPEYAHMRTNWEGTEYKLRMENIQDHYSLQTEEIVYLCDQLRNRK